MQMGFLNATNSCLKWHLSENIGKTEMLVHKLCSSEFASYLAKSSETSVSCIKYPIKQIKS